MRHVQHRQADAREQTGRNILDAAERLLGRYGYRKMTVDDLAREAGIGKGTVYLSFPSKRDVVLATVDRIVDAVCDSMRETAATGAPPPQQLRDMLLARVLIRFDRVAGYRESLGDLLGNVRESLIARRTLHFRAEAAILARTIARGQSAGIFIDRRPALLAGALVRGTNDFLPYSLSPAELGKRRDLARAAGEVIDLLVDGLRLSL